MVSIKRDKTKPPYTHSVDPSQRRRFIRCKSDNFPFAGRGITFSNRWFTDSGWGKVIDDPARAKMCHTSCLLEMALFGVPAP